MAVVLVCGNEFWLLFALPGWPAIFPGRPDELVNCSCSLRPALSNKVLQQQQPPPPPPPPPLLPQPEHVRPVLKNAQPRYSGRPFTFALLRNLGAARDTHACATPILRPLFDRQRIKGSTFCILSYPSLHPECSAWDGPMANYRWLPV